MNLNIFFNNVRASVFGGSLTVGQVEGQKRIIAYRDDNYSGVTDDQLAYVLATVFHETGRKMVPVKEAGSEAYLRSKKYWPHIGVGLVQVTWLDNWRRFGIKSVADGLSWPTALHACYAGMCQGLFTGKKLSDYISGGRRDYVNARRIINGTDRAAMIAGYAEHFRVALIEARQEAVPPLPTQPDDNYVLFKEYLLRALAEDPDVRGAILAVVFPDEPESEADPMDEPHDEYGNEPENVAYYDDDYASQTERNSVV